MKWISYLQEWPKNQLYMGAIIGPSICGLKSKQMQELGGLTDSSLVWFFGTKKRVACQGCSAFRSPCNWPIVMGCRSGDMLSYMCLVPKLLYKVWLWNSSLTDKLSDVLPAPFPRKVADMQAAMYGRHVCSLNTDVVAFGVSE